MLNSGVGKCLCAVLANRQSDRQRPLERRKDHLSDSNGPESASGQGFSPCLASRILRFSTRSNALLAAWKKKGSTVTLG